MTQEVFWENVRAVRPLTDRLHFEAAYANIPMASSLVRVLFSPEHHVTVHTSAFEVDFRITAGHPVPSAGSVVTLELSERRLSGQYLIEEVSVRGGVYTAKFVREARDSETVADDLGRAGGVPSLEWAIKNGDLTVQPTATLGQTVTGYIRWEVFKALSGERKQQTERAYRDRVVPEWSGRKAAIADFHRSHRTAKWFAEANFSNITGKIYMGHKAVASAEGDDASGGVASVVLNYSPGQWMLGLGILMLLAAGSYSFFVKD